MNGNEFLIWLGSDIKEIMESFPPEGRPDPCRLLVAEAMLKLDVMTADERTAVLKSLHTPSSDRDGYIGNYRVPYDIRDVGDFVGAIVATLVGHLE